MTRRRRILIAVLAPPLLGAISFAVANSITDRSTHPLLWLPTYVMFAYPIAIIPSAFYASLMDTWVARGLHRRFGLVVTALLSASCGTMTGLALSLLLNWPTRLAFCGGLVGAGLGLLLVHEADPVS